jgi:hypothetical protein
VTVSRLFLAAWALLGLAGCSTVDETFFARSGAVWVVPAGQAARPLTRVPADAGWDGLGYEANNRYLLAWRAQDRELLVLHAGTGGRIKTVPVELPSGFEPGTASAVRWRGRHVWIADRAGASVAVVQLDTGRVLRTLPLPGGRPVRALAYDRAADALWVLRDDGVTLEQVTPAGTVAQRWSAPFPVRAVAVRDGPASLLLLAEAGLFSWDGGLPRPLPWPTGLPEPGLFHSLDHGPNAPVRVF